MIVFVHFYSKRKRLFKKRYFRYKNSIAFKENDGPLLKVIKSLRQAKMKQSEKNVFTYMMLKAALQTDR